MPRYFFHTRDGGRDEDDIGVELADAVAARREAVRYSGSLVRDDPDITANSGLRVEVIDEEGHFCSAVLIQTVDAERAKRRAA